MPARKKRSKKSTTPTRRAPMKRDFIKPPGIRVEDVKPNTVFRFTLDGVEEIHLALGRSYGTVQGADLNTWCLSGKNESPCSDFLIGSVDWDYKIEILGMVDVEDVAKKLIRACKRKKTEPKSA